MSLAMAYNMKRKRKADGGLVHKERFARGETADKTNESGHEKGIHTKDRGPLTGLHRTYSTAGKDARVAAEYSADRPRNYADEKDQTAKVAEYTNRAKEGHRRVLSEMKADKTNRKNLAHGGDVKGVHMPYKALGSGKGESKAGDRTRWHQIHKGLSAHHLAGNNKGEAMDEHENVLDEMRSMKGPTSGKSGFAEGGLLTDDGYQSECSSDCNYPCDVHMSDGEGYAGGGAVDEQPAKGVHDSEHSLKGVHRTYSVGRGYPGGDQGVSMAGHAARMGHEWANQEHRRVLNEMKADKRDRKFMSEGGKVANSDELTAGFMPNEFDDLDLRDDLESTYTGANSGDELGDEQEDDDRNDMVARIMRSWAKRAGHNPRPA